MPCICQIELKIATVLPKRYVNAKLDPRHPAWAWVKNPTAGLLLIGETGTGKTHLAAAIVRWRLEHHKAATFKRCEDVFLALRETFKSKKSSEAEILDPLASTKFLVLDDLAAGSLSDHERRSTLAILDRRINDMLPTVVTSNWSLSKISELMDDRIASRLSSFAVIELQGSDRRVKTA